MIINDKSTFFIQYSFQKKFDVLLLLLYIIIMKIKLGLKMIFSYILLQNNFHINNIYLFIYDKYRVHKIHTPK